MDPETNVHRIIDRYRKENLAAMRGNLLVCSRINKQNTVLYPIPKTDFGFLHSFGAVQYLGHDMSSILSHFCSRQGVNRTPFCYAKGVVQYAQQR